MLANEAQNEDESTVTSSESKKIWRQNHVGTTMLQGVPIVSLTIDGKERLCLAQISSTLLREYSYNEIHNRRVALGITCVQCTPVQLEILRRAGAMPISSRRCGMISKREAERLVKSFLEEASPPKLPEDFAFDCEHHCGWGCQGQFIPARYNSSRAKCIKCSYCHVFFSPNKFIFHHHRLMDSKYNHPDAANFNSWRRHLKLAGNNPNKDIVYAWEDVKAMFNGGSRKRLMNSAAFTINHERNQQIDNKICDLRKKPKLESLSPKQSATREETAYSMFCMCSPLTNRLSLFAQAQQQRNSLVPSFAQRHESRFAMFPNSFIPYPYYQINKDLCSTLYPQLKLNYANVYPTIDKTNSNSTENNLPALFDSNAARVSQKADILLDKRNYIGSNVSLQNQYKNIYSPYNKPLVYGYINSENAGDVPVTGPKNNGSQTIDESSIDGQLKNKSDGEILKKKGYNFSVESLISSDDKDENKKDEVDD